MDASVIRSAKSVTQLKPRPGLGLDFVPFLVTGDPSLPNWVSDIDALVDVKPLLSQSATSGAVILIQRSDRVFALAYGTGYHAVEGSVIEPGFGLKVAAGLIAERRVRGAQTRGVAGNSKDQRTMLPSDGSFTDLDVAIDEDWLRQISGRTEAGKVASSASGADSLRLTLPEFLLTGIGAKLDEVLSLYNTEAFRANFPFLDQITPLPAKDPRISRLDDALDKRIRAGKGDFGFAAPDPFDVNENHFDHYEIALGRPLGRFEIDDLDAEELVQLLQQMSSSKSPLHDVDVWALDSEGKAVDRRRAMKAYLVAEQSLDGDNYLLTAGLWFVVSVDFAAQIDAAVARISDISDDLALPEWDTEALRKADDDPTVEGSYNKFLHRESGYALLDKELAQFGPFSRLEVADLLTPAGELLCVKSASKSSALSHLVAQAVNSSAAWGSEPHQKVLQSAWKSLPGNESDTLARGDAKYVLAIATSKPGPLHDSLFFFTKVLLANGIRSMSGSQIEVVSAKIPMKVVPAKPKPRKKRTVKFK